MDVDDHGSKEDQLLPMQWRYLDNIITTRFDKNLTVEDMAVRVIKVVFTDNTVLPEQDVLNQNFKQQVCPNNFFCIKRATLLPLEKSHCSLP